MTASDSPLGEPVQEWVPPWKVRAMEQTKLRGLFSSLPLDIVRLVFEKAMEDRPWPMHLLWVSRQTQHWLEPLIYEHITLYSERQFRKFYQTFHDRQNSPTKDSAFFQRSVRTLFVCTSYPRPEMVVAIIQELTGIRALACWDANWGTTGFNVILDSCHVTPPDASSFPYTRLRKISFSASHLVKRGISFTHRAFRDLTHMDVYFNQAADWESLSCLSNLTHLSLDMVTELPTPSGGELDFWFSRILNTCPSGLKVVIFGCVDDHNADFDLIDSDGDYLPPGWPPHEILSSVSRMECSWDFCLIHDNVDIDLLHPISRLTLGKIDARAVAASVTDNMPHHQLFREYLVYFIYPDNRLDWDGTESKYRDCWTVAEDIIERREGLTYSKLLNRL